MSTEQIPLAERLSDALSPVLTNPDLPWLWRPLLRLLAHGHPLPLDELAAATGHSSEEVRQALAQLPDAEYDEHGRLVGYGLTQRRTSHHFTVDGHELYTWCALDTLLFPVLLGWPAEVESPCHATGTPVRLTVEPDGVAGVEPTTAVVSIVTPGQCTAVRSDFCNQVHFFASTQAAQHWLAEHPGATTLPVAEAFTLGRHLAEQHLTTDEKTSCC